MKIWSVEPPRKNHELVGAGWLNRQTVLQVGLEQTDASFTLSQVGDGDVLKCVGLCEVWGSIQTPGVGSKKSLHLNRLTSTNFVNEIKAMDFTGTVSIFTQTKWSWNQRCSKRKTMFGTWPLTCSQAWIMLGMSQGRWSASAKSNGDRLHSETAQQCAAFIHKFQGWHWV